MGKELCFIVMTVIVIFAIASAPVGAAEYPTRPITLINPMAPGGLNDVQGRAFAVVAEKLLGQPLVIVTKTGAGGLVGGYAGAQAAPDGYTLTIGSSALTGSIGWEIFNGRKPSFTRHDFITIGSFTLSPTLVIVPYDSPWKSLSDLINDAKAKPGHYAFSSGGLYGATHISALVLAKAAGLKFRAVHMSGGGPSLTAALGKHVDFTTAFPPTSIPLIRGNKLRALAVQSDRRLKHLPEVPSVKELGIDAEYYAWVGILAPQKTPTSIVEKLREVTKKVTEDRSFIDMIEKLDEEVRPMIGDEFAKYWDSESEKTANLYKQITKDE